MSLTQLFVHLLMFWKCSIGSPTHHQRHHVQLHWNSSNGFFHSSGFLTVYLGDSIDFLCPSYERTTSPSPTDDIEYNALYLVNEHDYHRCNTVNYHPLLRCTKPFDHQRLIYTLSISKYLPYPNLPEFADGHFYYFISTSSGHLSHIDQRYDGLCHTKKLKLIVNVEKYSSEESDEHHPWPLSARRSNVSFIQSHQRMLSFSSSASTTTSLRIFLAFVPWCFVYRRHRDSN